MYLDFTMAESHQLRITPNLVLGFTEGSFSKKHAFLTY